MVLLRTSFFALLSTPYASDATRSGIVGGNIAEGADVASELNHRYFGFNPRDDRSPLGVTITMHGELKFYCKTACYNGHADCRMSASLYNKRMLKTRWGGHIALGLERSTGVVWHQDAVEQHLHKCSYIFDGSSYRRYNGACGCGAVGACSDRTSAYGNVCPSSGQTCRVTDHEVDGCSCDVQGEPRDVNSEQCFFKGPALDRGNVNASRDQLRWMAKTRVKKQDWRAGQNHDPLEYWNEIILDEQLMLPMLRRDSGSVVQAFIYKRGSGSGRSHARKMRDEFVSTYPASSHIPIIAIDVRKNVGFSHHIFFAEEFDLDAEEVSTVLPDLQNLTVV